MDNKNTIVLLVDVQQALMQEHPFREETLITNLKKLIFTARQKRMQVIYVRHDGGEGDELARGTQGWQIYDDVAPQHGEKIFDKTYNSAFKDTALDTYLKEKNITNIILGGLQTEYCIDATCKSAFERGYNLYIPSHGTSTYDNDFFAAHQLIAYFEQKIWDKRYASVLPLEEILKKIK